MPAAKSPLAAPLKKRNVGWASSDGVLREELAVPRLELGHVLLLLFGEALEHLAPAGVARDARRARVELEAAALGRNRNPQRVAREDALGGRRRRAGRAPGPAVLARAEHLQHALRRLELARAGHFLDQRFDVRAQKFERLRAGLADQMEVPRVAVGVLEAEPALAEVHLPGDAGVHHPLQRAIDRRAADPRVLAADERDEIFRAEVPLLLEEDPHDEVALAGAAPSELAAGFQRTPWRIAWTSRTLDFGPWTSNERIRR